MPAPTGEFPRPLPRPLWLAARARNAANRPVFIVLVALAAAGATLASLLLAPQQIRRVARVAGGSLAPRPDTMSLVAAAAQSKSRLAAAESSLAYARAHVAAAPAVRVEPTAPAANPHRDSLASAVDELDALLTRVETAPVAASFRALAESPELTTSSRLKPLLDSLTEVEHEREAFGTTGAADPEFIALTSRSSQLGREIQTLAESRRDTLRLAIAKLNAPVAPTPAATPAIDTSGWAAERDSAQALDSLAHQSLAEARATDKSLDEASARARSEAALAATPVAMAAAAVIVGLIVAFGLALVSELRRPRVSDDHEAERLTGVRVLATIRPRPRDPDRQRRRADRNAPPYFDPGADGYQLAYLHVARTGASRVMLTVTSDDTRIAAIVAANIAAIAADEARSTLIIDTDAQRAPVACALRIHAEPGVADVLRNHLDLAEITAQAAVGRDRTIDVVSSGISTTPLAPDDVTTLLRREAPRLARHYDAIIVVAPLEQATAGLPNALPIPDTIVCARVGSTRADALRETFDQLRANGAHAAGIVLWRAPAPALPSADRIAKAPRPVRTAEMEALTTR